MQTSTRYVTLKVKVEHEDGADIDAICNTVVIVTDQADGAINESEVVAVLPHGPLGRSW